LCFLATAAWRGWFDLNCIRPEHFGPELSAEVLMAEGRAKIAPPKRAAASPCHSRASGNPGHCEPGPREPVRRIARQSQMSPWDFFNGPNGPDYCPSALQPDAMALPPVRLALGLELLSCSRTRQIPVPE
jgi:hypothetical protein